MKVLVTGAAGFIGSNLARKLCEQGETVIGFDNLNDYYSPALKERNLQRLSSFESFSMVRGDIRDKSLLEKIFQEYEIDSVAHLAAMAGVRNAIEHPVLYVDVDYNGTQNLLEEARKRKTKNFVFASTSSVYGDTQTIPFIESDPCDKPLQPYAAAKRAAEILGHVYHKLYNVNFTAVRFFTVYGPSGRPDMMACLLAESITKGNPIPLYDGGSMYRDWTFVEDITDGIALALRKPLGFEILNLGRGEPVLLKDFIQLLEELAGKRANLVPTPRSPADMEKTYADISKAKKLIGYSPKVSVPEGVRKFWEWYKDDQR